MKRPVIRDHAAEEKSRFAGGATASKAPDFARFSFSAHRRVAVRGDLGAEKHGEGNWKKDLDNRDFVIARLNHVIIHAYKLIAKLRGEIPDDGDDDAAAIAWGGLFACEATSVLNVKNNGKNS